MRNLLPTARSLSPIVCFAIAVWVSNLWAAPHGEGSDDRRFNVLFIAVDDMRAELGCYGSKIVQSPNLDRLAQQSLLFQRAYCQQALCNPSRASLMTGLRLPTLGFSDLLTHFRDVRPDIVTLPQLFKQQGYETRGIGKLFHNWRQEQWQGDALSWSTPQQMHYASHSDDQPLVSGPLPAELAQTPRVERRDVPDEAYFDGRIANAAIETLREVKDQPFFLGVGFWKPHLPFNAPAKYWDLYDEEAIRLPENGRPPTGVPAIALHDSRELLRGFPNGLTTEQVRTVRHGYYAAISYVDAQIGKVLDELDRLGLRQRTIVVFWSDHGFHLGEHDLWCKTSNFELDARVPLMISVPGQATAGKQSEALVELLDLYPTLVELCRLPTPHRLQGVSLRPILDDASATVKVAAFTQHPRPAYPRDGEQPEVMGYSVRTDRYRYTEWRAYERQEIIATELYDHQVDPLESKNLSAQPASQPIVQQHAALLDEHLQSLKSEP